MTMTPTEQETSREDVIRDVMLAQARYERAREELEKARRARAQAAGRAHEVGVAFRDIAPLLGVTTRAGAAEVASNWQQNLEAFRSFVEKEGRLPAKAADRRSEAHLARWVSNQRRSFKQGRLSADRITQLETVPGWVWGPTDSYWQSVYEAVIAFANEHGRLPSRGAKDPSERMLGLWASTQRQAYKRGKLVDDLAYRVKLLAAIPGWSWDPRDEAWQENYKAVLTFVAEHGRLPSHGAKDPNERVLGVWVRNQRLAQRQNKLAAERVELLKEAPEWRW